MRLERGLIRRQRGVDALIARRDRRRGPGGGRIGGGAGGGSGGKRERRKGGNAAMNQVAMSRRSRRPVDGAIRQGHEVTTETCLTAKVRGA